MATTTKTTLTADQFKQSLRARIVFLRQRRPARDLDAYEGLYQQLAAPSPFTLAERLQSIRHRALLAFGDGAEGSSQWAQIVGLIETTFDHYNIIALSNRTRCVLARRAQSPQIEQVT